MSETIGEPSPTRRQIASRENGAKSKGPVTEEGKKKSCFSALRHGLCSSPNVLLKNESLLDFTALRLSIYEEYDPQSYVEILLIERIVANTWKLNRIVSMGRDLFDKCEEGPLQHFSVGKGEALLLARYQTSIERSIDKAIKLLEQMVSQRLKATNYPHNPAESEWRKIVLPSKEEREAEAREQAPKPSPRQVQRERVLRTVAAIAKNRPPLGPRRRRRWPEAA